MAEITSERQKADKFVSSRLNELSDRLTELTQLGDQLRAIEVPKSVKGDPGEAGKSVDKQEIITEVLAQIKLPKPKDGKDAQVTEADIEKVLAKFVKDKGIKQDSIEGLDQTLSVLRNFMARGAVRGGGDTVAAGSNITITSSGGNTRSLVQGSDFPRPKYLLP